MSKAGLQDFAVLQRVGVMFIDKTDLTRRWSVQPPHRSGDSDVTDVSAATDGIVSQMPLFRSGVHPCCLVLICLTEQCVGDGEVVSGQKLNNMRLFEFSFPVP